MARVYQRGNKWYADYTDETGVRDRCPAGRSKKEAEQWLKVRLLEVETGVKIRIDAAPLFGQYAKDYLEWYQYEFPSHHPRVESIVENHFKPWTYTPLDCIDTWEIERYKVRRKQEQAKSATITKEIRTLKAMLNRAVQWKLIPEHPCEEASPPKLLDSKAPHYYLKEQLTQLYDASPNHRFIWQFMANTGLRLQEALNLQWADTTEDRITVVSTETARTKSRKFRHVPMSESAKQALDMLAMDNETNYVLPHVNSKSLSRAFRTCATRAKLPGTLHSLRHTFCTHLVLAGVPLPVIRDLAGHSSVLVTEKYLHVIEDDKSAAVTKLAL